MLNDDEFVQVIFEQFSGAAIQLERLSNDLKVAPLDLTLRNLIDAYEAWNCYGLCMEKYLSDEDDPKEKSLQNLKNKD